MNIISMMAYKNDAIRMLGNIVLNKKNNKSPSMALTFANNSSSSSNAFTFVCVRFARDLENASYGDSCRSMNNGYRKLSRIV
jgi:hypothetical protein